MDIDQTKHEAMRKNNFASPTDSCRSKMIFLIVVKSQFQHVLELSRHRCRQVLQNHLEQVEKLHACYRAYKPIRARGCLLATAIFADYLPCWFSHIELLFDSACGRQCPSV